VPAATGLSVVLTVVSDSLGMKWASPGDTGFGLAGMAERAVLYGGTVSAGPAPDGGWTVHATSKGSHS
jgi:signal transduction histidine kinase